MPAENIQEIFLKYPWNDFENMTSWPQFENIRFRIEISHEDASSAFLTNSQIIWSDNSDWIPAQPHIWFWNSREMHQKNKRHSTRLICQEMIQSSICLPKKLSTTEKDVFVFLLRVLLL